MTKITARNRTNRTVQFYLPGSRYMQIAPHGSCTLERVDCQSPTLQKLIREGVIFAAESSEVAPSVTEATEMEPVPTAPVAVVEIAPSDTPSPITITPGEVPQTTGTEESVSEGPEANATASSPADRTQIKKAFLDSTTDTLSGKSRPRTRARRETNTKLKHGG